MHVNGPGLELRRRISPVVGSAGRYRGASWKASGPAPSLPSSSVATAAARSGACTWIGASSTRSTGGRRPAPVSRTTRVGSDGSSLATVIAPSTGPSPAGVKRTSMARCSPGRSAPDSASTENSGRLVVNELTASGALPMLATSMMSRACSPTGTVPNTSSRADATYVSVSRWRFSTHAAGFTWKVFWTAASSCPSTPIWFISAVEIANVAVPRSHSNPNEATEPRARPSTDSDADASNTPKFPSASNRIVAPAAAGGSSRNVCVVRAASDSNVCDDTRVTACPATSSRGAPATVIRTGTTTSASAGSSPITASAAS